MGSHIRRLRQSARMTQEELATAAGIGRVTLVRGHLLFKKRHHHPCRCHNRASTLVDCINRKRRGNDKPATDQAQRGTKAASVTRRYSPLQEHRHVRSICDYARNWTPCYSRESYSTVSGRWHTFRCHSLWKSPTTFVRTAHVSSSRAAASRRSVGSLDSTMSQTMRSSMWV